MKKMMNLMNLKSSIMENLVEKMKDENGTDHLVAVLGVAAVMVAVIVVLYKAFPDLVSDFVKDTFTKLRTGVGF
jgi:uncharacterized membrane protein